MDLRRRLAKTYRDLDGPLGSNVAAEVLVPLLVDLVKPTSVVDVGCGVGSFVQALAKAGIDDVVGVDAAKFDLGLLVMNLARLHVADLREPLDLGRRFDLVLCLEVGGYLADAEVLVASLIRHGPVVAFSSAVPGQDLAHQPYGAYLSTWAARFATVGFELIDPFRGVVWNDDRVPFWFRQNLVLFVAKDYLAEHPALLAAAAAHSSAARPVDVIHPELYELLAGTGPDASLRLTLLRVPRILAAKVPKVRTRLRRFYRRGRATASA